MKKMEEIAKFHALFELTFMRKIDLSREMQFQLKVLADMGVETNNEIHNRDRRKSISIVQAERALASVRQAAGIDCAPLSKQPSISDEECELSHEAAVAAYMRATGK
ncbi:hypothetical protein [Janthinobacterium sp. P210006]|uniref:hypothetical protein n=1 Tax=Janthinobacterium sp. P210006 TaxID=3112939 RepID=UPI002E25B303|nr:hypothetical protein [Janthinobacterium sp. P210006]